jgi:glucokinase
LNWKNVPLREILSGEIREKILVENDANCAAWGAYCLDAQKDCRNLICLTLGTGIGGGIVVGKKLYRGATGSAGEIGHMSIEFDGRACRCGNFGCLESMIGAWGLIQTAEEGLKKGLAPILKKILRSSSNAELDPRTIERAAREGDPYCGQLWKDAGRMLGSALASLVNVFNPERIILSGGVSKAGSLLLEPALHTMGSRAFAAPAREVKVTVSKFDQRLGVAGAALLLWE